MDFPKDLTFAVLDDLAFSATGNTGNDQRVDTERFAPRRIGPLVECAMLAEQGRVG